MSARALLPGLSAAGALALATAVLVAGTGLPAPALGAAAAGAGVAVPAAAATLVCPGAPVPLAGPGAAPSRAAVALQLTGRVGTPGGTAPSATALTARPDAGTGGSGVARSGGAGIARGGGAAPATATAAPRGRLLRVAVPGEGGGAVTAAPVQDRSPVLAGATTALAASGDLRGLSAPACLAPGEAPWLVGGTTGVGRSVRLVIANPGPTATTVDTTVLTGTGPQQPPSLQGLSLGAGERRSVLLEGAVDGTGPLAVQVRPAAGRVTAWLTEQVLRGLVPGGGDVVVPGAAPSRHQLVPGVVVPEGGGAPVLRLAAPGARPVVARYALLGADGALVPAGTSPAVVVPAGSVVDVPLPGLGAGEVTAVVDGNGLLVAGALTDTAPSAAVPGDTAWTTTATPLDGQVLVALPPAVPGAGTTALRARLVLTAPGQGGGRADGDAAVDVRVLDAAGTASAPRRVQVRRGTTTGVDVAQLASPAPAAPAAPTAPAAPAAGSAATGSPLGLLVTPVDGSVVVAALRVDAPAPEGAASGAGPLLSVHPVAAAPSAPHRVRVRLVPGS